MRISIHALGKLWAILVVNTRTGPLAHLNRAVGIDWGVKEIVTATDPDYDLFVLSMARPELPSWRDPIHDGQMEEAQGQAQV